MLVIKQIEELHLSMIKIKEGRSFRDPEVVTVSKILDAVLDRYQAMLMIKKTEKD